MDIRYYLKQLQGSENLESFIKYYLQAITPLLEFLDQHLSSLNTWLLPRAFSRALAGCWSAVLKEVSAQADAGGAERPRVYHHRLREALDLLAEFFHAEGKGMQIMYLKIT